MLSHFIRPWQYLPTLSDETNFFYLYTPSTWFRASWEVRDIPPWRARMIVASSNNHFRSFVSSTVHRIDRVAKVCVHTNDFWFLQPWKESQIFLKICWKVSGYYFNVKNGLILICSYTLQYNFNYWSKSRKIDPISYGFLHYLYCKWSSNYSLPGIYCAQHPLPVPSCAFIQVKWPMIHSFKVVPVQPCTWYAIQIMVWGNTRHG